MIAFPQAGVTTQNRLGQSRTWDGQEFICVTAVDPVEMIVVHGTKADHQFFIPASQLGSVMATDTSGNRKLLENFHPELIKWIRPRRRTQKSVRKPKFAHISHIDGQGWGLNAHTGERQLLLHG